MNKLINKIWHSPTFTSWGNYAAQSLRLLLVTPLILTRFNETEIAAWYLFASLNFFGEIVAQRLGGTFSRMFAFAMGGLSNLSPIKSKRAKENDGKPNWKAFERAYGTIGSLNLGIGWINTLVAFGMGWFGLNNILSGYEAKGSIWLAFGLLQFSSLLSFSFQRYLIALQGMNYIALTNRWNILFSLVSVLFGFITLWCGGGIIALVIVMQFFVVIGVFRNRFLLHKVEDGRVIHFKQYGFDREVFRWAWEPTWKGMLVAFSGNGVMQITAVLASGRLPVGELSNYLFTIRIWQTIQLVSFAPFGTVTPLMSRYLANSEYSLLRQLVFQRSLLTLGCLFTGLLGLSLFGNYALGFLDTNIKFLTGSSMLALVVLGVLIRYQAICVHVVLLGNEVVLVRRRLLGAAITLASLYQFGSNTFTLIIIAVGVPFLFMGLDMTREAAKILDVSVKMMIKKLTSIYFLAAFILFILYYSIF